MKPVGALAAGAGLALVSALVAFVFWSARWDSTGGRLVPDHEIGIPAPGGTDSPHSPSSPAQALVSDSTAASREPSVEGVSPDVSANVNSERLVLEGRVALPDSVPSEEELYVVAAWPPGKQIARARALADGRFRLEFDAGVTNARIDIEARYLFLKEPFTFRSRREEPGPFVLHATLGGRLQVRLVLVTGGAVPEGLELRLEDTGARARASGGNLSFDALAPGEKRLRLGGDELYLENQGPFRVVAGEALDIELRLIELAFIEGRVVDSAGDGVAGAFVYAPDWPRTEDARASSGVDGKYRLALPAVEARVIASHGSYGMAEVQVQVLRPGETRSGVDLMFEGSEVIVGQVLLSSGEPVAARLVLSLGADGAADELRTLDTAGDGAFRFEALGSGMHTLFVRERHPPPGRFPRLERLSVLAGEQELRVVLADGPAMSIEVLDDTGSPVLRYDYQLAHAPGGKLAIHRSELGRGPLMLTPLSPGRYALDVSSKGHIPAHIEFEIGDISSPATSTGLLQRQVVLPRSASLAGFVVRPDGLPAGGALVKLGQHRAVCDDLGRFVLAGVKPGEFTLSAESADVEGGAIQRGDIAAGENRTGILLEITEP